MEGQAHPTYYDLHLDHTVISKPHYPPHYPHLCALREELASWCFFYFEPRERMRLPNPVKEVRHIGLMGEELAAFLNTLRATDDRQFKALERSLRMVIPSATGIDVAPNNIGEVELKIGEGNLAIPARVVSEGTLRVLGLLSLQAVREPMALVGFEEPENGVHPRRIRLIAEILQNFVKAGGTQLIVTTHSPLLPDLLPPENLYVCRRSEGKTEIACFETWGPLAKRQSIEAALDDVRPAEKSELTVSERVLRGDFDA
jgi:predicted ATPase